MEGVLTFLAGFILFGVILFIGYAIISKVTGRSVGYRGGITYRGETLASPDTLNDIGRGIRKIVDKKYKIKLKYQEEFKEELRNRLAPIDVQILLLNQTPNYSTKKILGLVKNKELEEKQKEMEKDISSEGLKRKYSLFMPMSDEEVEKLDKKIGELEKLKQKIIAELVSKYENKI